MTPEERANKLTGGLTSCQILVWDVVAAIREAEQDALERAAQAASTVKVYGDDAGEVIAGYIRALKIAMK